MRISLVSLKHLGQQLTLKCFEQKNLLALEPSMTHFRDSHSQGFYLYNSELVI